MTERVADRGWQWPSGTVREQASALVGAREPSAGAREALGRLVTACERAHFALEPVPADSLREDVRTVVAGVDEGCSRWERLRATWLPTPTPARPAGGSLGPSSPGALTADTSRRG
jgi:hypothetical protein